ncbi:MAG: 2-succinyl-5-enolpyruvyl-6-hydroxy-3-cyclohexene-1-carboxylic-acid synthase [Deltaproteobacteria bacterium RIFCSPLOWO2_02_FULL_44_10]|nr:MAG: 2-succinyl-5-enolpyruvyl-6-hydroxy-3-cyclohexene-1-carboxylic-acid synthase [Deltaproteobacteria bacterium RIFCSPHIGHO2_02_FULL_44_16]OGQ46860.1 MAG: 2-succinyl-5-enolpyruvyl-6-hydroxy-3-cyclohexene-1-carboxylic-acid synthase [Deltaproteobacteria bacterium RIFCSPLOWO2_02_FULL_44_10]
MSNMHLARELVSVLIKHGVREVVLCPGSRNAPLVMTFQKTETIKIWTHFEERSAAFFALGRARCKQEPVAVVTTSGTAVAELLPATIEAYYSSTPLVLVTADRPKHYRGTGAPQSIEQENFFSPYVSKSFDLEGDVSIDLSLWDRTSPIHLNICFDEPLLDEDTACLQSSCMSSLRRQGSPELHEIPAFAGMTHQNVDCSSLQLFLERSQRLVVLLGALQPEDHQPVSGFLLKLKVPVYAEAHSGLREYVGACGTRLGERRSPLPLLHSAHLLNEINFDAVLRLGSVPTTRFWRDLEVKWKELPVFSVSRSPFSGLARKNTLLHVSNFSALSQVEVKTSSESFSDFFEQDRLRSLRLKELYEVSPCAEPSLMHTLSQKIPKGSLVYLGNSLPLREWDLAATRESREYHVLTNRGANGIDGQLSTFFGLCEEHRENWAIVGDLTALYDLSAPWILDQLSPEMNIRFVVINNKGGMIFSRMFDDKIFQHRHSKSFEAWAVMWNLDYQQWNRIPDKLDLGKRVVIELIPDESETAKFWDEYQELRRM